MRKNVILTIVTLINLAVMLIADKYFGLLGIFIMAIFASIFYRKVKEKL